MQQDQDITGTESYDARYLAGRLSDAQRFYTERAIRLEAMLKGWCSLSKLWGSRTRVRFRRAAFKCLVQGAGLSGLTACCVSPSALEPVDVRAVKF